MLENLHDYEQPSALVNRLKDLAARHYGHAGREFLKNITSPERIKTIHREVACAIAKTVNFLAPLGSDGQVRRVAQRFAICGIAGSLARQMGILPRTFNALDCVEKCFRSWLEARGGMGAYEDAAILSAVRLFIEQHGASRFQDLDTDMTTCVNRVGFRRKNGYGTEYIILPEAFKAEVVKGYSARRAGEILRKAGWLKQTEGKSTTKRDLPGLGRVRAYVLAIPEEADPADVFV